MCVCVCVCVCVSQGDAVSTGMAGNGATQSGQRFNYLFYVDFVGTLADVRSQNALRHLQVSVRTSASPHMLLPHLARSLP